jgi:hypothetical protein
MVPLLRFLMQTKAIKCMEVYMKKILVLFLTFTVALFVLLSGGCEKEKIVESTEYIHDIEYIELPPDTVFKFDTLFVGDTLIIQNTDTITLFDTVVHINHIYDTIYNNQTYYDTTFITDTVTLNSCTPNEFLAIAALQYYSDPLVIEFINNELGYTDGWIFYLSSFQLSVTKQSSSVYDLYGYIDYWSPDWNDFYALEYYWRMTHTGGDPADPDNWQIGDPPTATSSHPGGIKIKTDVIPSKGISD